MIVSGLCSDVAQQIDIRARRLRALDDDADIGVHPLMSEITPGGLNISR